MTKTEHVTLEKKMLATKNTKILSVSQDQAEAEEPTGLYIYLQALATLQ